MGYGGDLMLATSIAEYCDHTGHKVALVQSPNLTDLLKGRIYRPLGDTSASPIFQGSPHIVVMQDETVNASKSSALLDKIFVKALGFLKLTSRFDQFIQEKCYKSAQVTGVRYLYKDDIRFSYAASILPDRMIWQNSPNAVAAALEGFLEKERPPVVHPQPTSSFYGLETELSPVKKLMAEHYLESQKFIVIEPSTNADWFADIRAWSMSKWDRLVQKLKNTYPDYKIVRVGVLDDTQTDGVVDLRGKTSFREVAALLGQSKLFIGTEGGLMHAAGAVDTPSAIIWGGLTLPDFAGYPDKHMIIEKRVACAPCGLLGNCPNNKICIDSIQVEDVEKLCDKALTDYEPGITSLN